MDKRTIEFKLREGVMFHNGEEFDAGAVRVNWEAYRKMECPSRQRLMDIPGDTIFAITDKYIVRFIFPEPDGLALVEIWGFGLFAPSFLKEHKFQEGSKLCHQPTGQKSSL